ncbi:MAG TPA: RecQ family ATP-dependent DNA helicase [Actinomycetales bacterium]|nr:RecQ family ATP-dependent DNA helicase [Actinomycetales bacterium]
MAAEARRSQRTGCTTTKAASRATTRTTKNSKGRNDKRATSQERPTAARIRRVARETFGWDELRPGQLDAVQALVSGHDALVVMPTGAGKSAVYQVAGLLLDGPTVVVSPLIALQRDQLAGLARSDAPDAVAVNSAQRTSATEDAWEAIDAGEAEFLFLSPEQLAKDDVVDRLADARPSLLAVDEAHCVSAWGHDFRPDYLRIGDVLERLGRPRVVALTATASPPVREEVVERLRLTDVRQVVRGFDRPNLRLEVHRTSDADDTERQLLDRVAEQRLPGLVYAATRKGTERYAQALTDRGLKARAYHAGMKAADRREVHEQFLDGGLDVVVATTAFGMGIDKPDVRFVVHAQVSDSLDSYYQEIGRSGRDGAPATAVLLYRPEDLGLRSFFASGGADEGVVREVAAAVRRHTRDDGHPVAASEVLQELDVPHSTLTRAVNLLEQADHVRVTDDGDLEYVDPRGSLDDAVDDAVDVAETHKRLERSRVEMMRGYAETTGCRRQFLLGYFGEELTEPCGNCDTCTSGSAEEVAEEQAEAVEEAAESGHERYALNEHVVHRDWGPGVVMRPEGDRVTVLFEEVGYRTLAHEVLDADPELLQPE